ncbi:helix-turn-helix transcriptional regulator [Halorubrum kocurii]|uniref:DUF7343 domain-containing protein n=1 Tax=Halorubrum kocurii JCM 14978 TaxID=1230456 RepID=M0P741_9EURY|nr:MarR family transcriptional regulator [Halorubrum kocurii]EMA65638.1 hypothetical protein C468_06638 [Halorubrum kocurii JCM 14978]
MNRRRADAVVGVLLGFVLLTGGALTWRAYRQRRAFEQSMGSVMEMSMGWMHGPDPLWYAVGTLFVAGAIGGVYVLVRGELTDPSGTGATERDRAEQIDATEREGADQIDGTERDAPAQAPTEMSASATGEGSQGGAINPESDPKARVLDLLPDDERRVLEPVLSSPGVTQIELRDRSEFSKSKVSQTVSSLEERGLLYRERQGRTYRVYPSDDLRQQQSGP